PSPVRLYRQTRPTSIFSAVTCFWGSPIIATAVSTTPASSPATTRIRDSQISNIVSTDAHTRRRAGTRASTCAGGQLPQIHGWVITLAGELGLRIGAGRHQPARYPELLALVANVIQEQRHVWHQHALGLGDAERLQL